MSSLRNSLHRRNHKERSQLSHRSRLGILEKHKDYVLRARDYHSKQDRINRLRQKAADRNKDEFYFAMNRQKTKGGVHIQDRGNEALPVDIVKVLKSQDENYIRTTRLAGMKKIEKLKSQLSTLVNLLGSNSSGDDYTNDGTLEESEVAILQEAGLIHGPSTRQKKRSPRRQHILFADSDEQAQELASAARQPKSISNDDETQDNPTNVFDSGWKEQSNKAARDSPKDKEGEQPAAGVDAKESRSRLLKELSSRLLRDRQLRYAERELEMQKLLMGKGASRKLSGVEKVEEEEDDEEDDEDRPRRPKKVDEKTWKPRVYKWKQERKR